MVIEGKNMTKKWSSPKGKKTQTVKKHTRRVDVRDAWGRFAYTKHIDVEEYKRRKPKKEKMSIDDMSTKRHMKLLRQQRKVRKR